jgi:hypothetical protein
MSPRRFGKHAYIIIEQKDMQKCASLDMLVNMLIFIVVRYSMNSPLDRDILINRFVDIETNTPLRKERFRKLDELYLAIKTEYQLTSQEILSLTKELLERGVTIRQRFFSDAIHRQVCGVCSQAVPAEKKFPVGGLNETLLYLKGKKKSF